MNFHQIKQRLHGFFFDDYNDRERNEREHLAELWVGSRFLLGGQLVSRGLAAPDLSRVWGTDISHWDGNVDLQTTKNKGASFVFIKGLDGTLQTSNFAANRARAIAAGLPHAPYQWLYRNINVPCVAQAQAMKALLDKYSSDLPPVIDFEWTYWGGSQSNPNWVDLDLYVSELNKYAIKPILYTAKGYADTFGAMPSALKAKFSGFWFANYGVTSPALPLGFSTYDFWQFTSSGDASVYSPNDVGKLEVDINYYNGTKEQFTARFGGVTELPPTGGTMFYQATGSAIIKQAGSPTAANALLNGQTQYILGPMSGSGAYGGDVIEADAPVNSYVKIKRLWCNGAWRQLPASAFCLATYLKVITFTPPPDPVFVAPVDSFHTTFTIDHNGKKYAAENIELLPIT